MYAGFPENISLLFETSIIFCVLLLPYYGSGWYWYKQKKFPQHYIYT